MTDDQATVQLIGDRKLAEAPTQLAAEGQPTSGLAISLDRREAIARQEHRDAVRRLQLISVAGAVIWPLFALQDLLVVTAIEPGPLPWYLGLRALGLAALGGIWWYLEKNPEPSPGVFRAIELGAFTGFAGLISVFGVFAGGIASSYGMAVILLMLVRTALLAEPWRRGVVGFTLMWLCFPLAQGVAALVDADAAARFADPRAVALFGMHNVFIAMAAVLGVVLGHLVYRVRREAYDASELGRYQLKFRIGKGGMGEVWVAHHRSLKRDVALKVLKPGLGESEEAVARFEREVMATSRLTHPNTVRVMDHGVTPDGLWYYAMELLDGRDLAAEIRAEGPLEPTRTIHLMSQACGSLAEAHRLGFVHRDIKPENLYVANLGGVPDVVKVLDFGIARVSQDLDGQQLTKEGIVTGTPHYLSPEAIRGKPADARSDVYALGCVLYAALTGQTPYSGDTAVAVMMAHLDGVLIWPSKRRGEDLPGDLETLVMRCLERNPAQRYTDAGELEQALLGCAEGKTP
jgi:eukaryotic-like serine/threonine-protein kinase